MKISLSEAALGNYVAQQLSHFFPDRQVQSAEIAPHLEETLSRVERCFTAVKNKYYFDGQQVLFDHLHSDQYASFLYLLANTIKKQDGNRDLASKVYYLNKTLHSLDVYFEVNLPEVFFFVHPVGTVLGRATYGSYLVVYQRCTIGGNLALEYPTLGEGVALFGNSAVVGRSTIGDNCLVATGALIMDKQIPSNVVAFGTHPHVEYKQTTRCVKEGFFRI